MDGAGERFQLLQGGLDVATLPFGQLPELCRQVFLRNSGALARPAEKFAIDSDAGHGRSPAKLAKAAIRTWKHISLRKPITSRNVVLPEAFGPTST